MTTDNRRMTIGARRPTIGDRQVMSDERTTNDREAIIIDDPRLTTFLQSEIIQKKKSEIKNCLMKRQFNCVYTIM